jgi:hypothetical protein
MTHAFPPAQALSCGPVAAQLVIVGRGRFEHSPEERPLGTGAGWLLQKWESRPHLFSHVGMFCLP